MGNAKIKRNEPVTLIKCLARIVFWHIGKRQITNWRLIRSLLADSCKILRTVSTKGKLT